MYNYYCYILRGNSRSNSGVTVTNASAASAYYTAAYFVFVLPLALPCCHVALIGCCCGLLHTPPPPSPLPAFLLLYFYFYTSLACATMAALYPLPPNEMCVSSAPCSYLIGLHS